MKGKEGPLNHGRIIKSLRKVPWWNALMSRKPWVKGKMGPMA